MRFRDIRLKEDEDDQLLTDRMDEDAELFPAPRRIGPELIMAIIAVVAALLLIVTVGLCLPHIREDILSAEPTAVQAQDSAVEDPLQALRQQNAAK